MIVDLALFKSMQGIQVGRTTKYTNHSFDPIEARLFKLKGDVIKETDMLTKTDEFWVTYRQVPLTKTENSMDLFVNQLQQIPGFKFIISVPKHWLRTLWRQEQRQSQQVRLRTY